MHYEHMYCTYLIPLHNAFRLLAISTSLDVSDSNIAQFYGILAGFKYAVNKPPSHDHKRDEPLRHSDYKVLDLRSLVNMSGTELM
jgi:hypothetical protein